ncbi:Cysteine-rich receptor-like protein kinase 3 [Abeliophyllum distichum]|uniref:Cysteine-rich receptor-like protein kinase 3 n=1 Tax=Abeliophyllum distichum TaxID=126358 RepID=A0ABD1U3G8_9LAMI
MISSKLVLHETSLGTHQVPLPQGLGTHQVPLPQGLGTHQVPLPQGLGTLQVPLPQGLGTLHVPLPQGLGTHHVPLPQGLGTLQVPLPQGLGTHPASPNVTPRMQRDSRSSNPRHTRVVCGVADFGGNQSLFRESVEDLVRNMSLEGPKNDGFFTRFVNTGNFTVYGLAQCWEFVNGSDCGTCLKNSVENFSSCTPKTEGRILNAGCYLRYSTTRFYNNSGTDESNGNGGTSHRRTTILASICGAVSFLLFAATVSFFMRKKMLRQRRDKKRLGAMLDIVNKSKLNFPYETLEKATNYFHASNKLGQGGSGSVYKGILPGGQTVAIKRLFFNTTQWVDHFFNELEKMFPSLSWEERFKIIFGIAEGLAYLHEESKLRIIHRDIKLSNILLDEDFTPKIADFGLARLFPEDKTHICTAIAGTLGYMAPEYLVRGKLTEKADVYSFGVVVIEVVCGTKNYAFSQNSHSILQKVWNLYGAGKLSEAVDPSLENKFQEDEASRVLQIGLICVQASAELRPSMSIVVKMLTENHEIPQSTQPPFLNSINAEGRSESF